MLKKTYDWAMDMAGRENALWILAMVAFAESSFFIIPPDLMLIPMVLACREKAWRIAAVCTLFSVLGGIAGYGIGFFLWETAGTFIINDLLHAAEKFEMVKGLYGEWGWLIVFTAGFSPIPYKIFTIASGVMHMDPLAFTFASAVSRGGRFFLVAAILWHFGEPMRLFIEKHLGKITLAVSAFLILAVILWKVLN